MQVDAANPPPGSRQPAKTQTPGRYQFTVLRLLACTTLVALAAWVTTLELPVTVMTDISGGQNLLPIAASVLLVAAAVGALLGGRHGAAQGAYLGCTTVFVFVVALIPLVFAGGLFLRSVLGF